MMVFKKMQDYAILMRWHRPIGILLLLWPTLWAIWIASGGKPSFKIMIIFILGVVVMRSAGCVMNDVADRHYDGRVERTKDRPLATGCISVKEALILFAVLGLFAFFLVLMLNDLTIFLAFIGALLTVIYPFAKRVTHLPQIILGVTFGGWSVLMAFSAQQNALPVTAWFLFVIASIWPVIYDTMYAMVDYKDDLKIGVKSTAILWGGQDKLMIGILQILMLFLFIILATQLALGFWFYLGLLIAAILCVYQQYLIKDREPASCFKAFLNNSWLGMVIFVGLILR